MRSFVLVMVAACSSEAVIAPPANTAVVVSSPAGWADVPAWPAGGDRVELAWIVGVDHQNPKDPEGLPLRPVELAVTVGTVTRHVTLPPETGNLTPFYQPMCRPAGTALEGAGVAQIVFYEGGASGYTVTRRSPDVLAITHWSVTDGLCTDAKGDPTPCPTNDTQIVQLHVPASAAIGPATVSATENGTLALLRC